MSGEEKALKWLRQRIEERRYLARHAVELGSAEVWAEQSSGVLVTGEPAETDVWYGTWPLGDSSLARLMEANDPRDTIARCESELAILDEHQPEYGYDPYGPVCITCGEPGPPGTEPAVVRYPCKTVRLIASAYRHRDGYADHWADQG